MKSAARVVGAHRLGELTAELEREVADRGDAAGIETLSRDLEGDYACLARALDGALSSAGHNGPDRLDTEQLALEFAGLRRLLEQQDLAAFDRACALRPQLETRFGIQATRFHEQVERFDFPAALVSLHAMMRTLE